MLQICDVSSLWMRAAGGGCGRSGEIEGENVEMSLIELAPVGGDGIGASHEAGLGEVADEDFRSLATRDVVSLFAVGNSGEAGIEFGAGYVDFGEDADTGEPSPVVIQDAGDGADAGNGVSGPDAQVVEGMGCAKDVVAVPTGRRIGED